MTAQAFEAAVQSVTSPAFDAAVEDADAAKKRAEELERVVTKLLEMKP